MEILMYILFMIIGVLVGLVFDTRRQIKHEKEMRGIETDFIKKMINIKLKYIDGSVIFKDVEE